ncbi:myb-like DNA-binding domain, shaqkyf class protein [Medicago truncatula]|uniref:Myb-like DNA-binding domain, shaqkyf class protein n=1 Tax=Medicago truncatula TaxID=3880 RepID=A0A072VFX5_MEDTR|nr:myb-like DNA-binding domain, shaqkyf class protein [Medicago truncatula]
MSDTPYATALKALLFLLGLDKYGKGDWRSISRNFVVTRTPTQVASHAQKYFIRLNSMNKDRRRSSIHDITSVNNGDVSTPQGPITGQTNGSSGNSAGKSVKQAVPSTTGLPGAGMYAAPTIGQPIGGPLVSAVGTPVNLSAPPHMAYGIRAPVPGTVVSGAPVNMVPMTYPMPHHTSAPHRLLNCYFVKLRSEEVKNQHENKSGVGEMRMLRWICGKTKRIGLETTTLESWDHTYSRKDGVNEA